MRLGQGEVLNGTFDELQVAEAEHLRLQVILDDVVVAIHLRAHHHDGQVDARTAQLHALVGEGHSEIIDIMELQDIRHLKVATTIAEGLHHHHELGFRLDLRSEVVEVAHQMVEVDLKHSLVRLFLQLHANLLKFKGAGTLQQDRLVVEL